MSDLGELRDALALALRGPDPVEAVRVLCRSVARTVPADGAAISTIGDTRHRETLCASDRTADVLEELQFFLGEGPCFEAFRYRVPVLVPDLEAVPDPGWPVYRVRVLEESSARAVFVFPLVFGSVCLGTLSACREVPGPLDAAAVASATELAETTALVLLGVEDPEGTVGRVQAEATTRGPGVATRGHEQVHVADGMVAERLGLPPDAAFDRIRGHAFARGRLLVDVASDIVTRQLHAL